MGLLVTSYLVLTNMGNAGKTFKTQVFTASDLWIYACKLTVIAAIFEYGYILRMRKSSRAKVGNKKEVAAMEKACHKIDRVAFVIFAVAYAVFIAGYVIFCVTRRSKDIR